MRGCLSVLARVTMWAACVMGSVSPAAGAAQPGANAAGAKARVAVVEIKGALPERQRVLSPMGEGGTTLRDVTGAIARLAGREEVKGILLRLREAELSLTQVQEIGRAVLAARGAGKRVFVFSYGYDTPEIVLGAHCDQAIAQVGGGASLPGLASSEMYLADTLAWAGLKADLIQVGDYKGAADPMINRGPSEAWSKNIDQLLDSLYAVVRERIKEGRRLDDAGLDAAMNEVWMASAEDAKRAGLIDATVDLPALGEHLSSVLGAEVEWEGNVQDEKKSAGLDASNPFAALRALMEKPTYAPTRPTIAVLHIDGAIVDGESGGPGLLGGEGSVGSLTIRRALATLEKNDLVKGVVVRIDSPGGSAIASEVIWQGLKRVSARKPVWVSVGGMAASGGYYIAVAGDRIYVNPGSIVGSIGVVGGKLALEGLMQTLKVNVYERTRGPRAGMAGLGAWDEEQRAYIRRKMTETYDLFTRRVSAGRKGIDLSASAEGRLFAGQKAIDRKMADRIGGLDEAIADLAASVELAPGSFDVMSYPAPMTLAEMIERMLGQTGMGASAEGASLGGSLLAREVEAVGREVAGPAAWPGLRASIRGLMELRREPVLLVSPRVFIVR